MRTTTVAAILVFVSALGVGYFLWAQFFAAGVTFRDCSDCPQMVIVDGAKFLMGSPKSEPERDDDEGPQHSVTVRRFAVQAKQVTRAEFSRFVAATHYPAPRSCATTNAAGWIVETPGSAWNAAGDDALPVACVSWADAMAYAHWLSQRTGQEYALMSEAEWEYLERHIVTPDDAAANAFGVEDLYNTRPEWVADCHSHMANGEYVNDYRGAPTDGSANEAERCDERIIRGGYGHAARDQRPASRDSDEADARYDDVGFRVVRELAF